MNSTYYKSKNVYGVMDKELFDCCTHQEVPSMQSILQHLLRTGSTPPGVEINYPETHRSNDDFDTNIDYRKPSLQDLNKQFYAMKEASTSFNDALREAAEVAKAHQQTEQSDVSK